MSRAGRYAGDVAEAAILAQEGFTGPRTVLEDKNGFCAAGTDELRIEALSAALGERYEIDQTSFRPFYGCTLTIAASRATADILARHPSLDADDIAQVTVRCHPSALREIDDADPETLLAARLSMQYNVALVIDRRDVLGAHEALRDGGAKKNDRHGERSRWWERLRSGASGADGLTTTKSNGDAAVDQQSPSVPQLRKFWSAMTKVRGHNG